MAGNELTDGESIDLASDNIKDTARQVDTDTYLSAFNAVVLPSGMPDYLKAAIEAKSEEARDVAAESGYARPRENTAIDIRIRQQRQADEDNLDYLGFVVGEAERQREMEEWMYTRSTVGGVTKTGKEWAHLAERLRTDEELKDTILAAFRKRGMSEEEANRRYDRVAEIAAIAAKPPSQRTEQETEDFERANADPSFGQDMKDA